MSIEDDDIQWLLSLVESEQLEEVEVHVGEDEVLVRRGGSVQRVGGQAAGGETAADDTSEETTEPLPDNVTRIEAPMTGVFYRAASPESDAYVSEGQRIEKGDTVGLIEVMKLYNDVHAPVDGVVHSISVSDEEHVEAGQTLMLVET